MSSLERIPPTHNSRSLVGKSKLEKFTIFQVISSFITHSSIFMLFPSILGVVSSPVERCEVDSVKTFTGVVEVST